MDVKCLLQRPCHSICRPAARNCRKAPKKKTPRRSLRGARSQNSELPCVASGSMADLLVLQELARQNDPSDKQQYKSARSGDGYHSWLPSALLEFRLSHRGASRSSNDVKSLLSHPFRSGPARPPNAVFHPHRKGIAPCRERHTGIGRRRGEARGTWANVQRPAMATCCEGISEALQPTG